MKGEVGGKDRKIDGGGKGSGSGRGSVIEGREREGRRGGMGRGNWFG